MRRSCPGQSWELGRLGWREPEGTLTQRQLWGEEKNWMERERDSPSFSTPALVVTELALPYPREGCLWRVPSWVTHKAALEIEGGVQLGGGGE